MRSLSEAVSHVSSAWVYLVIPQVPLQHVKIALIRVFEGLLAQHQVLGIGMKGPIAGCWLCPCIKIKKIL